MRNLARLIVVLITGICALCSCVSCATSPARTKVEPGTAQLHRESTTQGARESSMKFNFESPKPADPVKIRMRVYVDSSDKQKEKTP